MNQKDFKAQNARFAMTNISHIGFSHDGPVVWNSLPRQLRKSSSTLPQNIFTKKFEAHLFPFAYRTCSLDKPVFMIRLSELDIRHVNKYTPTSLTYLLTQFKRLKNIQNAVTGTPNH